MCGGTTGIRPALNVLTGLSPRVRGNLPDELAGVELGDGSIPACAGEPDMFGRFHAVLTVYPRVCGGTCPNALTGRSPYGLSPRVRGNLPRRVSQLRRQRSIPACAGEPSLWRKDGVAVKVYPRVCGGTKADVNKTAAVEGLSPRVRGNLAKPLRKVGRVRSIPACAGEPRAKPPFPGSTQVYPRVCGGTCNDQLRVEQRIGLSPRVRGNLFGRYEQAAGPGSIPACAGEPASPTDRSFRPAVYPRVCGGTIAAVLSCRNVTGLSPRVRGNHEARYADHGSAGSIPACAGEPRRVFVCRGALEVYPRVCGGTNGGLGSLV